MEDEKPGAKTAAAIRPAERRAARIAECRVHSPSRSASTRLSDYRRWPRLIPSFIAFWRTEPIVLFIALATLATGVFAFECARNSFTCSLVYRTRVRFFAFLATKTLLSVRALSIIQLVLGNPFQKYQLSAGSLSPSGLGYIRNSHCLIASMSRSNSFNLCYYLAMEETSFDDDGAEAQPKRKQPTITP